LDEKGIKGYFRSHEALEYAETIFLSIQNETAGSDRLLRLGELSCSWAGQTPGSVSHD
jgi:hypothetical protein